MVGLEIERKYLHADTQALQHALRENNAVCLGRHFESNWVFDTSGELFAKRHLLRLRRQEWRDRTQHVLTFKMPASNATAFKKREERETALADGKAMHAILLGLGYTVTAQYEKIREPWRLGSLEVDIDILPFGEIVELEGPEEAIVAAEGILGLAHCATTTKTYHELHQDWLRLQGKPASLSITFAAQERQEWRQKIGLRHQRYEGENALDGQGSPVLSISP